MRVGNVAWQNEPPHPSPLPHSGVGLENGIAGGGEGAREESPPRLGGCVTRSAWVAGSGGFEEGPAEWTCLSDSRQGQPPPTRSSLAAPPALAYSAPETTSPTRSVLHPSTQ